MLLCLVVFVYFKKWSLLLHFYTIFWKRVGQPTLQSMFQSFNLKCGLNLIKEPHLFISITLYSYLCTVSLPLKWKCFKKWSQILFSLSNPILVMCFYIASSQNIGNKYLVNHLIKIKSTTKSVIVRYINKHPF